MNPGATWMKRVLLGKLDIGHAQHLRHRDFLKRSGLRRYGWSFGRAEYVIVRIRRKVRTTNKIDIMPPDLEHEPDTISLFRQVSFAEMNALRMASCSTLAYACSLQFVWRGDLLITKRLTFGMWNQNGKSVRYAGVACVLQEYRMKDLVCCGPSLQRVAKAETGSES